MEAATIKEGIGHVQDFSVQYFLLGADIAPIPTVIITPIIIHTIAHGLNIV
ncbi:MAG: hypothetical protein Q8936_00075 [Bacillota bacterium]|nr:hypothetical protein [Bacillota bacterium]